MTKQSGLGDNLYISGYDLSGDIGSLDSISGPQAVLDVTSIDKSAMQRIGGERDGLIEYTAFFDKQANQAHSRLSLLPTTDQMLTYCRGTAAVGEHLVRRREQTQPRVGLVGLLVEERGVLDQAVPFAADPLHRRFVDRGHIEDGLRAADAVE